MGQANEKEDPIQLLEKINFFEKKLKYENITSDKSFNFAKNIINEYQNYKSKIDNIPKKIFGIAPLNKKTELKKNGENYDKNKVEEINHNYERINKWIKMAKTPYINNLHFIFQKIRGGSKEKKNKNKKKMSFVGSMKNLKDKDISNCKIRKQTEGDKSSWLKNDNCDVVIKKKKLKKNNSCDNSSVVSNDNDNNKKYKDMDDYTDKKIEEKIALFYLNNKSKFLERVSKGPPNSFRWISWCIINDIPLEREMDIYNNYLTIELKKENKDAIIRDIERTFSDKNINNKELREKETSLYNILKAFWNLDKEVGYCQGMNLIVGFLLLISEGNELDTFYLLISNFSSTFKERKKYNYSFRGLFLEEFPLLYFLNFIFDILLEENIPEVKKHLDEMGITYDLWIGQWFQTLFTIILPVNWCKRVWDCIYSDNIYFLVKFGIAFTGLIKSEILEKTEEINIIDFFKDLKKYSLCPENKFLEEKSDINSLILKSNKIKLDPEEYIKLYKKKEEEIYNEFNLKMEKTEKISYLLKSGNKEIIEYKAKHRKTVLFRSIEEENIGSDEVIIMNPIQNDLSKIRKNKFENDNNEKIKYDPKNKKLKITIKKCRSIMENVKIFEIKNVSNEDNGKKIEEKGKEKNKVKEEFPSEEKNKNNVDNKVNNNKVPSQKCNIEPELNCFNTPYKYNQIKIPKIEIQESINNAQKDINSNTIEKYKKFINKKNNNQIYYPQTEYQNNQQNIINKNINKINQNNLFQNYFGKIDNEQNNKKNFFINDSNKLESNQINKSIINNYNLNKYKDNMNVNNNKSNFNYNSISNDCKNLNDNIISNEESNYKNIINYNNVKDNNISTDNLGFNSNYKMSKMNNN